MHQLIAPAFLLVAHQVYDRSGANTLLHPIFQRPLSGKASTFASIPVANNDINRSPPTRASAIPLLCYLASTVSYRKNFAFHRISVVLRPGAKRAKGARAQSAQSRPYRGGHSADISKDIHKSRGQLFQSRPSSFEYHAEHNSFYQLPY